MSLSFLKTIKVEEAAAPKRGGGGARKPWNPLLPFAIRLWKSGAIFPSQQLTERFDLEYRDKPPADKEAAKAHVAGIGFDVFASADSKQFTAEQPLVWISPVEKSQPKVDLFGSTGWDEEGKPLTSVMDQGATTFGKNILLPLILTTYGITINDEGFIDLVLLGRDEEEAQEPFTLPNGKHLAYMPKRVSRGEAIGELTYAKRESPMVFVLYPYALLHPDDVAGDKAINAAKEKHSAALMKD